jgi:predicted lysophospholipase L1 biosynthesis ABC-type transport system permease subunit
VNELGVFAMTDRGLRGVSNPSALFLSQHEQQVAGSCVLVTQEGTRPLLVEIQALVDEAHSPSPRRLSVGLEQNRLAMLLAVLHRHAGVACFDQDVFVNAVGGVKIGEPAADLAVLLAIVSSLRNRPLPQKLIAFGESRPGRRDPPGAARPGAPQGSRQARLHACPDPEGQCAEATNQGDRGHSPGSGRAGRREIARFAMKLSWQMLKRDFRAGELRLLGLALLIAVASLTSVSFFTDRLSRALTREAHQLLGGDLLLLADHPWDASYRAEAGRLGLRVTGSVGFPSMTTLNGASQLADIKAVEPGYPLRGSLRTAPGLNLPDAETNQTPGRGTVWLDERLMAALEAKVGDVVQLGNARFAVSAVLTLEPDRGVNFFNIAPRLMMHAGDLPATQLIQVGSRVTWRLHLAGEAKAVAAYRKWAEDRLGRGERVESLDNARPEVRGALDRAEKFLRLAALLAAVLAAVAVGLAARRFMQRHLDGCAVMRCLGAREGQLLRLYLGEFLLFGAIASALGCLAGFGAQHALERLLASLLTSELPAPSLLPLAYGFAVGLALLAGFALPQLMRLRNVPTVRVLRREWAEAEPLAWTGYAFGAAVLAGLMLWMAADLKLGLWVLGLFSLAVAVYAGVARLALAAAGRLRGAAGAGWRYGIASLRGGWAPA